MVEETVRLALVNDAGVAALVGSRVYPQRLPDNVKFPAIAYRTISRVPYAGNCKRSRIQLDLYAETYTALKQLRGAVEAMVDTTSNFNYIEGPDLWQDGQEIHHQTVDVVVYE